MKTTAIIRFSIFELKRSVISLGFAAVIGVVMLSSMLWVISQKVAPQITGSGGYYFLISAMRFNVNFLFPFLALIFSSVSINYDSSQGILATLTAGYISRAELAVGKFISLISLFVLFFLTAILFNILLGGVIWGYADIAEEGITILSYREFFPKFVWSSLLPVFPMITLISLGFLFSVLFKNIIASISTSIGTYLVLDVVREFFTYNHLLPFYSLDLPFKELVKFTENYLLEFNINYVETVIIPITWIILLFCTAFLKLRKMDFYA